MADTFLLYRPDPFGVGSSRYALATSDGLQFIAASEVGLAGGVVPYDFATLFDDLGRNRAQIPAAMVDISEAIRLATGLSRADGGEPRWNFWRRIRSSFKS